MFPAMFVVCIQHFRYHFLHWLFFPVSICQHVHHFHLKIYTDFGQETHESESVVVPGKQCEALCIFLLLPQFLPHPSLVQAFLQRGTLRGPHHLPQTLNACLRGVHFGLFLWAAQWCQLLVFILVPFLSHTVRTGIFSHMQSDFDRTRFYSTRISI